MSSPDSAGPEQRRRQPLAAWAFVVLMLALTVLFAALGVWQLQRLAEKEALIATVAARIEDQPVQLPPADRWETMDWDEWNYRPVTVTGRLAREQSVLVFTSRPDTGSGPSGPGYWVMTPLRLDDGGGIFINRGYVPQTVGPDYLDTVAATPEPVTLSGIARLAEEPGPFTPEPDVARGIEWVRDVHRLQDLAGTALAPLAPIYIDLPAGPAGELPLGGGTTVEFPNNHLGYAMTWLGFALLTPALLAYWLWRRRRESKR